MPDSDFVGASEIAERLGVKPDTVWKWAARGLLPKPAAVFRSGSLYFWPEIELWARENDYPKPRYNVKPRKLLPVKVRGRAIEVVEW